MDLARAKMKVYAISIAVSSSVCSLNSESVSTKHKHKTNLAIDGARACSSPVATTAAIFARCWHPELAAVSVHFEWRSLDFSSHPWRNLSTPCHRRLPQHRRLKTRESIKITTILELHQYNYKIIFILMLFLLYFIGLQECHWRVTLRIDYFIAIFISRSNLTLNIKVTNDNYYDSDCNKFTGNNAVHL